MTQAIPYYYAQNTQFSSYPASVESDIWAHAQHAVLKQPEFDRYKRVLYTEHSLQPSQSQRPVLFSPFELTDYLFKYLSYHYPPPITQIRGFIAGGAAVHVLTARDFSDVNIRFYFNHPEPLRIVRNGIYDFFSSKLWALYPETIGGDSFPALLRSYVSKTVLREGYPTSFAWFGLGAVDIKCFYTVDAQAHTLSDQESVMIHLERGIYSYPFKEGQPGSLKESLARIKAKQWVPNFSNQPKQYLEMTLHRITEGYEIENFETLQPYLLSEVNACAHAPETWVQRKFLPFLARHYPIGTHLQEKQIYSVLNILFLLNRLDPSFQNKSIQKLKQCVFTHIPELISISPSFFNPFIIRSRGTLESQNQSTIHNELLTLQVHILRRALDVTSTHFQLLTSHLPSIEIKKGREGQKVLLHETPHTLLEQWLALHFSQKEKMGDYLNEESAAPPCCSSVLFEKTLELYTRHILSCAQAQPTVIHQELPKLFQLLMKAKEYSLSLEVSLRTEYNLAINRIFILYCKEGALTPLKGKIAKDTHKFFQTFSLHSPECEHFLRIAKENRNESSKELVSIILKQISQFLKKNQIIPSSLIHYILESQDLISNPFLIQHFEFSAHRDVLKCIPKKYHELFFQKIKTAHETCLFSKIDLRFKFRLLENISYLSVAFEKNEESIIFLVYGLSLYKQNNLYGLELLPRLVHFFEALESKYAKLAVKTVLEGELTKFILYFSQKNRLYVNPRLYRSIALLFNKLADSSPAPYSNEFLDFFRQSEKLWQSNFRDILISPILRSNTEISTAHQQWIYKITHSQFSQIIEQESAEEALKTIFELQQIEAALTSIEKPKSTLKNLLFLHEKYKENTNVSQALLQHIETQRYPLDKEELSLLQIELRKPSLFPIHKEKYRESVLLSFLQLVHVDSSEDPFYLLNSWLESEEFPYSTLSKELFEQVLSAQSKLIQSSIESGTAQTIKTRIIDINTRVLQCMEDKNHEVSKDRLQDIRSFLTSLQLE